MAEMSLLEFLRNLLFNDEAREDFNEDPEKALDDAGLSHLTADDVYDTLVLMRDSDDNDFSRDYETGGNYIAAPHAPHHNDGDSESAIEYINRYYTNNYVDDRDTTVDNSINQNIDTDGGDFDQDIDVDSNVVSGDGAVGAGDDIDDSNIVTGDDNTVGDGNVDGDGNVIGDGNQVVNGDGNTSSFGDGDASSTEIDGDLNADDGSAVSIGGNADVDNTDNSTSDSYNDETNVEDSYNSDHEYEDNSDNSVDNSYEDNSRTDDHSHRDVEIQA